MIYYMIYIVFTKYCALNNCAVNKMQSYLTKSFTCGRTPHLAPGHPCYLVLDRGMGALGAGEGALQEAIGH